MLDGHVLEGRHDQAGHIRVASNIGFISGVMRRYWVVVRIRVENRRKACVCWARNGTVLR